MTRTALRSSLALWRRRYRYRRLRWQAARKAEDLGRVEHWARLVDKAAHMVRRREDQLMRRRPLRRLPPAAPKMATPLCSVCCGRWASP